MGNQSTKERARKAIKDIERISRLEASSGVYVEIGRMIHNGASPQDISTHCLSMVSKLTDQADEIINEHKGNSNENRPLQE